MITLGIIGVVAALTMPALINSTQKREFQAGLKKQYSVMSQALKKLEYDTGEPVRVEDYGVGGSLKAALMPYFAVVKNCGTNSCVPNSTASDVYKTFSSNPATTNRFDDGQFITSDGTFYMFENPNSAAMLLISVDVNGYKKKPNRWGYDVFTFQLMPDGKILPSGAVGTYYADQLNYCSKTSTGGYNGAGCTYRALTDPNYWKEL